MYYRALRADDPAGDALRDELIAHRDRLDRWLGTRTPPEIPSELQGALKDYLARLRSQPAPVLVIYVITVAPTILYLIVGGWPQTSGLQSAMMSGFGWTLVRFASFVGLLFLGLGSPF